MEALNFAAVLETGSGPLVPLPLPYGTTTVSVKSSHTSRMAAELHLEAAAMYVSHTAAAVCGSGMTAIRNARR